MRDKTWYLRQEPLTTKAAATLYKWVGLIPSTVLIVAQKSNCYTYR